MSKEDFVEFPVDKETYDLLERAAKEDGLTVDEYVIKLIHEMYNALKAEES